MKKTTMKCVPALVAIALLAAAQLMCSSDGTAVQRGIRDQVLHIGNQTEPEDLDPHIVTGIPEFHIISALLEGLVVPDPRNLEPLPGVARSWDISPDRLQYTFHFRSRARWSNGDQVTASDFVFSFKRILSPVLASEYAYMLFCIDGAESYNKGDLSDFSGVGARAIDDTTLVIQLARPTPYFLSLIAHHSWYPVHPATILKHGTIDQRGSRWTQPGNFVANGPFVLDKWDVNQLIAVKKNEQYWDRGQVKLNAIEFHPIENLQTEERAFRTGQLHVANSVPLNKIEWYKQNSANLLRIDPYLGSYFYLVNVQRKPFDDPRVRRALALAIDRKAIVEYILKGGQLPGTCYTPPNTAGYTCTSLVTFDTAGARKLLAEAGYGPTNPFPRFSILYNTSESHHTVAQAIQQMWKEYLGIDVELVNQEWKVYLASKTRKEYDVARMGWIGDYNDPNTFLDMWISGGGNNNTGWANASYDSLIVAAAAASDESARLAYFQDAEKLLMAELPILPIYFYTNAYLLHPSVQGWHANLLNVHPYKFVYLDQSGI